MENKINVFGLDKLIQKQSAVTKSKILIFDINPLYGRHQLN